MADEGSSSRLETVEWANLSRAQSALEQRVENMAGEFQRFAAEMRREIRSLKGNQTPPASTPAVSGSAPPRSGIVIPGRDLNQTSRIETTRIGGDPRLSRFPPLESDSEEERTPLENEIDRFTQLGRNPTGGPCFNHQPKLEVPNFDGHLHVEDFLDWEQAVDAFFEYMEIAPEKQVKFVACKLQGGAGAWWIQLVQSRRREGNLKSVVGDE